MPNHLNEPVNPRLEMSAVQLELVAQAMAELDSHFDAEANMIGDQGRHGTRESVHYALGLLLRDGPHDVEKAGKVIDRVLDMQLCANGEIYDGTFRQSPERPLPPAGYTDWGSFPPGYGYANSDALDEVFRRFFRYAGMDAGDVQADDAKPDAGSGVKSGGQSDAKSDVKSKAESGAQSDAKWGIGSGSAESDLLFKFRKAANEVFPRVWQSFDPNWREFIACAFALILEHFEAKLQRDQVERIDMAMRRAVAGSLERYRSQSIPTNTNIELMHLFIAHYYGHRYGNLEWMTHSEISANHLYREYMTFHSFAEFNSSTYYGVDLTVLGMWRKYSRTATFRGIGRELEQGLWNNIAEFYEPKLENLCGPYARSYENEMTEHSSIGVFIYLALGADYRHLAGVNCETSHDPMIAIVGVDIPEKTRLRLKHSQGQRLVRRQFIELCERDRPGQNRHVCTATAWISESLMLGGMSGSHNTNGQMHNATAHWLTKEGKRYTLRMVRRVAGESWNSHLRGMRFNAAASERQLDISAELRSDAPIELVFEIGGEDISGTEVSEHSWSLPGLKVAVSANAPVPRLIHTGSKAEIVYPVHAGGKMWEKMEFQLRFEE